MHSFAELSALFENRFNRRHFPEQPQSLYDASQYILTIGGKRVRPVCVLMGNELFNDISPEAFDIADAIELFHNFSLIHDDIMDMAPLRRGLETVHIRFGDATALLAGDVMLVAAYDSLNKSNSPHLSRIISLFNKTAREVCEGQQLDMQFENTERISFGEYVHMITLKTSVLLAASLQLGAIIGGAGLGNQEHLYEFGKKLGIAFQIQDDYLDAFGDPVKFGKQPGGDIHANKKTFLVIRAFETGTESQTKHLDELMRISGPDSEKAGQKLEEVLTIFRACGVDVWAQELKERYYNEAMAHLERIAVVSSRKKELQLFAQYLLHRES